MSKHHAMTKTDYDEGSVFIRSEDVMHEIVRFIQKNIKRGKRKNRQVKRVERSRCAILNPLLFFALNVCGRLSIRPR